ncbi:MAG: class I tRNA ligase family protein [Patescibacteria group bacterium]
MAKEYDFKTIERKWQDYWDKISYGKSEDFSDKPKSYQLVEFPYPSGYGLHVGHCMGYGASDIYSRMLRMQGFNVMYPMGWDAFGLPTENFAIKTKQKPQIITEQAVKTFKTQMKSLGYSFDWDREINTTDPDYYKWTQWVFLQFYKHSYQNGRLVPVADDDRTTPRLAFQAEMPVNWCPSCKIVLANEEVVAGACERCKTEVSKKSQKQWMLRITAYADRLIKDLDTVDYLDKIKTQQINWIGRSEGTEIEFKIQKNKEFNSEITYTPPSLPSKRGGNEFEDDTILFNGKKKVIKVFTTRADTLFGCTYVVLSPECTLLQELKPQITNWDEIVAYVENAAKKSDLERMELEKDKTGVELAGIKAVNPINGEEVPVFVADYVLASYGTGAVMAVPAHDDRDFEFAKKYHLPIKQVVIPVFGEKHENEETRNTITAVVKRKSDGKFLLISWKGFGWYSTVVGGIELDETPEEAAEREVLEETGYKVNAIEKIGGITEAHFYHDGKKIWRKRFDQPVFCELIDEKLIQKAEIDKHAPLWLDGKEALEKITHYDNKIGLARYLNGNYSNTDYGILINSDGYDGLSSADAKRKITEKLKEIGAGDFTINFKLRDWIFSRQHYWGEPIPIVHCDPQAGGCGVVPLGEKDLPLTLPDVENYEPTETGESPLAKITDWVETTCPKCGGKAMRETDTMPNWAGSSWYFIAYALNQNLKLKSQKEGNLFDDNSKEVDYWMPVDLYNGGMEHTTLHLLYSRFWHKFLYDLGKVPGAEPYSKRIAHGIILGPDGRKMSKSFGNVINPDDIVKQFGADTLRAYIAFIGPYDQESAWSTAGVQGVFRWLKRLWNNIDKVDDFKDEDQLLVKLNQTIVGVTDDIREFRLNTVISKLMEMNNMIEKTGKISRDLYNKYLRLLYPAVPHIASELWEIAQFEGKIEEQEWPEADTKYLISETIEIVVQINGKVRDKLTVSSEITEEEMKKEALNLEKVQQFVQGKEIVKTIVVPKKLVSIVIK